MSKATDSTTPDRTRACVGKGPDGVSTTTRLSPSFASSAPVFDQRGDRADGGVAAQIGVPAGIHVKQAERGLRARRFGSPPRRHNSPVSREAPGSEAF